MRRTDVAPSPAHRVVPPGEPLDVALDPTRVAVELSALPLTAKQSEILAAAVHGVPRARLADALRMNPNTLKTHVTAIVGRLNVASLTHAASLVRDLVGQRLQREDSGQPDGAE